jgi:hypothetical protein
VDDLMVEETLRYWMTFAFVRSDDLVNAPLHLK